MVSDKKVKDLKELKKIVEEYSVVGILNMHKLPGKQLHDIRNRLRGESTIKMVKKSIIIRALEKSDRSDLMKYIVGEPALIFTKMNSFKLAKILNKAKSPARASEGDIAPKDIVIKEGDTPLAPGPVIGELQRAGLPVAVAGDKIAVKKDTVLVKEGEEIGKDIADVLTKLEIEPMEIGLDLRAVWDHGTLYERDLLFVPEEEYLQNLKDASQKAFNLSINIGYFTKENIPILLSKAHNEARSLADSANIITPNNVGGLLSKADKEAKALENKAKGG